MRYFVFIFIFSINLLAIDATMEIVKKATNLPIISIVVSDDSQNKGLSQKIKAIIAKDLAVSSHFNIRDIKGLKQRFDDKPNKTILRENNIDIYTLIKVENSSFGGLLLNIKVYDINGDELIIEDSFKTVKDSRYPFLSHRAAISINDKLDAPSIDWMDKFVIFSRYLSAQNAEIVIADYTLTYQKTIVRGGLNIFPKWLDANQEEFFYTTYNRLRPTLMKVNMYTGKKQKILSSDGMIVCSDVSSDAKKILVTMSPEGQPDIYMYDLENKVKRRITRYKGIDVGGSFVENDSKVVFVSDRLKYPNIFSKVIGQRGIERLVYHGRNNSSCTTYKDYIVYSSREGDNEFSKDSFNLYLISTKSDFIRRMTVTGRNQFPKFSADGESVLFIKTFKGKSSLGIMRINYNKSFLFPLKVGKLQSIDW
jgi:TolB protein